MRGGACTEAVWVHVYSHLYINVRILYILSRTLLFHLYINTWQSFHISTRESSLKKICSKVCFCLGAPQVVYLVPKWCMDLVVPNLFFFFNFYLFIYGCVGSFVSVWGPSLVVASGGHSSSWCAGLSLSRPLVAEHRLQTRRLSSCGSRA